MSRVTQAHGRIRRRSLTLAETKDNDVWHTPPELFAELNREFGFEVDVAAFPHNALCERFFTPAEDGIAQPWAPAVCWCNPPYSEIGLWTAKAVREAAQGATVVMLLPARTDSAWFHRDVLGGGALRCAISAAACR